MTLLSSLISTRQALTPGERDNAGSTLCQPVKHRVRFRITQPQAINTGELESELGAAPAAR